MARIKFLSKVLSPFLNFITSKKLFFKSFAWYLAIVLSFATIYWVMFKFNSTSFTLSDQFNKHLDTYFLNPDIDLSKIHHDAKYTIPIKIDDFCSSINPDFIRLKTINDSLDRNIMLNDKCESDINKLNKIVDEIRTDSVSKFKESKLHIYQHRIDSLKRIIEGNDRTEMIINRKFVELAKLEQEYAEQSAKISSYVVEKWGTFLPDSISDRITILHEEYMMLNNQKTILEDARRKVSSKIRDSIISFHQNRHDSVNYWDFLYYSICVSTTVSFGDIAPNNEETRIVSILELLTCIILIGYIVSLFQNKMK